MYAVYNNIKIQGCEQLGRALDMPPDAIISGLLLLVSFFMSHCAVEVPDTMWIEPAILWITITMPTGSGKTPLFTYLTGILQSVRQKLNLTHVHPPWLLDEASIEKMGELMATNHSKLLGMYDELTTFLECIVEKAKQTRMSSPLFCLYTMENLGQEPLVCISQHTRIMYGCTCTCHMLY
jgi:hypothetical protein